MAYLTKEQIIGFQDIKTTDVNVWGGIVKVKTLSALERGQFLRDARDKKLDETRTELAWVAKCLVDDTGKPLFNENEIEQLGAKSASEYSKLTDVIFKVNALSTDAIEEIKKK